MNRAEVRMPGEEGLQMQPCEVGRGKGDNQRFLSTRKEKVTPVAMGSHPMAKERGSRVVAGPSAVAERRAVTGPSTVAGGRESNPWSIHGGGSGARGIGDSGLKQSSK